MQNDLLEGLNEAQASAVEQIEGPVLILAGAGSGKTKTLTHRMAYMVLEKGVPPQSILAVTFTNKAAGEMRERVATLLDRPPEDRSFMPYLGTFHSICVRLLRIEAENIGLSRQFIIFDDGDSVSSVKAIMRELKIDEKRYNPRSVRSAISSAKNDMISPEEYGSFGGGELEKIVTKVYPKYEQALDRDNALDFDDLMLRTVRMFQKHDDIREKWRRQFRYIMIDEYQDTNRTQYELVKMLTNDTENICVVGDDWQSIYSWRGADFRNILNFEKDYPSAKVINGWPLARLVFVAR